MILYECRLTYEVYLSNILLHILHFITTQNNLKLNIFLSSARHIVITPWYTVSQHRTLQKVNVYLVKIVDDVGVFVRSLEATVNAGYKKT